MNDITVIIPARNEKYLNFTIEHLNKTAYDAIDFLVYLDGPTNYPLIHEKNIRYIKNEKPKGLKTALNTLIHEVKTKYILKVDAHVILGKSWDYILLNNFQDDWLSVPTKWLLDPETLELKKGPVNYLYMQYPYGTKNRYGNGLFPRIWNKKNDKSIDDLMTITGCCWFVSKKKIMDIGCMNLKDSTVLSPESEELPLKYWLSGGRVIRNKNTWYGHYWQKSDQRGYFNDRNNQHRPAEIYLTGYFMRNMWPQQTYMFKWLIDKFSPIPSWPENWQESMDEYIKDHPSIYDLK